jgi:hypothetical protein
MLRWLGSHPRLAAIALGGIVVVLIPVMQGSSPVTRANFDKIQIGTPLAEVHRMLGPPEFHTVEFGLVEAPGSYITRPGDGEEEARRRGFKQYRRQQWNSSEFDIIVISDIEDRVVYRYGGPGQGFDLLVLLRRWWSRLF